MKRNRIKDLCETGHFMSSSFFAKKIEKKNLYKPNFLCTIEYADNLAANFENFYCEI